MGKETIAGTEGSAYHVRRMKSGNTAINAEKAQLKALLERAETLMKAGDFGAAAQLFLDIIKYLPENADLRFRAGACLYNTKDFVRAAIQFEKAHTLNPEQAEIAGLLAQTWMQTARYEDAARILQNLLKDGKGTAVTREALSDCLARAGRWQELLDAHATWPPQRGITTLAREADAYIALGQPQTALSLLEGAEAAFAKSSDFWPVMGRVCHANRLFERELECHERALDQAPTDPRLVSNYGLALANVGRQDEALALFDRTLSANPLLANLYVNRASVHKKRHNLEKTITDLKSALEMMPLSAAAHYALGCAYVQNEDYESGWPHYEWNWHVSEMPKFRPTSLIPNWYGEDISDKHLLVYVDQGIGDTLMFARYLPVLLARYEKLILTIICEEKLADLLRNSFPHVKGFLIKENLKHGDKIEADYMVAFGSLPCILKTDITNVPREIPYLKTLNPRHYRDEKTKIVIGLTWSSKSLDAGHKRSLPLESYLFLKNIEGIKLIDLQYGDTTEERKKAEENGLPVLHDNSVDPFSDMQAHIDQIAACDLVISADNTTVHAAAALGKPVWTLLPYDSYWRWHLDHESTPWYPTMRLFRQGPDRSFAPVLERMEREVRALVAGDRSRLDAPAFKTKRTPKQASKKSALLLNDTSATYHWGCTATSEALKSEIRKKGYDIENIGYLEINGLTHLPPTLPDFDSALYLSEFRYRDPTLFDALERSNNLVINGEGTIHGIGANALRLLYLAYIAKTRFGKQVHIINHACFPEDGPTLSDAGILAYYLKGYRAADSVVVRDPVSHKILNDIGIKNTLGFDSLPLTASTWLAANSKPKREKRIVLAGSSNFSNRSANAFKAMLSDFESDGYTIEILVGAKFAKASEDATFCNFIDTISEGRVKTYEARSMDEWFSRIGSATLLVSGRFHYSIAAACMGTPFVAFEGNTPKLHALCDLLGAKPPLSYNDPELVMKLRMAIAKTLREGPPSEEETETKLKKLCTLALKNFEAI